LCWSGVAGVRACCGSTLDRGGEQLRQERIFFGKPVRFVPQATPFDDTRDAANHAIQHSFEFLVRRRRSGVKTQGSIILWQVGAVEDQRMEMDVQVECSAESLDEGDRTAGGGSGCGSRRTTSSAQRGEDGAHEHAQDICGQLSVVGQAIAQTEGQREDPLAYGNSRQHAVHEMRRRVGHVATAARGAEASSFAGEGNDPVQAEVVLDDAVKNGRLGMARGVNDPGHDLIGFPHETIVMPGSCRDQEAERIEFP